MSALHILYEILKSSYSLLLAMSPYLLFGFFFAGLLHQFISAEKIAKHLGKNSFGSVIKAALFGIPLPLCSCGVLPPTMALRKAGAGRGAVLSFLIATPTTGIDSIFATYSLLGPFFAVYRVIATFIAAIFSGIMANITEAKDTLTNSPSESKDSLQTIHSSFWHKLKNIFHYAFIELVGDISKWLVIGIVIGGIISYLLPDNFFQTTTISGWQAIMLMIVVGVPLYVCATGSIPIAAALLLKGINPGAAFVFLIVGPATNAVTLTVIGRYLGKKTTIIYLSTLIISSIGLGLLLDFLWGALNINFSIAQHMQHQLLPTWLEQVSAWTLVGLLIYTLYSFYSQKFKTAPTITTGLGMNTQFSVNDMTCQHCVMTVKNAITSINGVNDVQIDLANKKVFIQHEDQVKLAEIKEQVKNAGYTPD